LHKTSTFPNDRESQAAVTLLLLIVETAPTTAVAVAAAAMTGAVTGSTATATAAAIMPHSKEQLIHSKLLDLFDHLKPIVLSSLINSCFLSSLHDFAHQCDKKARKDIAAC